MNNSTHAVFQQSINDPRQFQAVQTMGRWFLDRGVSTDIPQTRVAPTHEVRHQYADKGDIFHRLGERWERGEAKSSTKAFTCQEDYPYRKFIVIATHIWDFAEPKPIYMVKLSLDFRYAAAVRPDTRHLWWKEELRPAKYNGAVTELHYWIATDRVFFFDLWDKTITVDDLLYSY